MDNVAANDIYSFLAGDKTIGSSINSAYYKYTVDIKVSGTVDSGFSGKSIAINFGDNNNYNISRIDGVWGIPINADGSFSGTIKYGFNSVPEEIVLRTIFIAQGESVSE